MIKKYTTITRPDYPATLDLTECEINKLLLRRGVLLKKKDEIYQELFQIKYLLKDLRRNRDRMRKLKEFEERS